MTHYFRNDARYITACLMVAASMGFSTYSYLNYMSSFSLGTNVFIAAFIALLNLYCPFWSSLCILAGFFLSFEATVNYLVRYTAADYAAFLLLALGYVMICRSVREFFSEMIKSYAHIMIFVWGGSIILAAFHSFTLLLFLFMHIFVNEPMPRDIIQIWITSVILIFALPSLIAFAYEKTSGTGDSRGIAALPLILRKMSFFK